MDNILVIIPSLDPNMKLINLLKILKGNGFYNIVVVDDGSSSKNLIIFKEAEKYSVVYHNKINLGKGQSIKVALKNYNSKNINGYITCDGDGQHLVKDVIKVANKLNENPNSIILGVRDFNSQNIPFRSKFGNKFSSIFFKLRTNVKCNDTQTGLRAFSTKYKDFALNIEGSRYEYEMNFLIETALNKIDFKYVKIDTIYENNNEVSHFNPIKDSYLIYKNPIRYLLSSITSFLIDILLFTIFINLMNNSNFYIIFATIIARITSGFVNFYLNKKWCFKNNDSVKKQGLMYFILFLSIMFLSSLLVNILSIFPINLTIIKICVDCFLFIISYVIQSRYIFKGGSKNEK